MIDLPSSPADNTGAVELWCIELQVGPQLQADCATLLDAAELERARRFVFERDRRRYVVHHAAARLLIARASGQDPRALRWLRGPHGRPSVSGSTLAVSLSRSHERALVGLAPGGRLGIDIEADTGPAPAPAWLAEHVDPAALSRAAGPEAGSRHDWFYTAWTRIEALAKARGTGLGAEADTPGSRWDPWQAAVALQRTDDEGRLRRWFVQSLSLAEPPDGEPRYHAALACDRAIGAVNLHLLDSARLARRLVQAPADTRLQA